MKHRRIGGMPGQESQTGDGGITDLGKGVAIAIIKRKVESMMKLPDGKPTLASQTVQGGIIAAIGILFGVASKVMSGETSLTDTNTIQQIFAAVGIIWGAIGARRAIGASGPQPPQP